MFIYYESAVIEIIYKNVKTTTTNNNNNNNNNDNSITTNNAVCNSMKL